MIDDSRIEREEDLAFDDLLITPQHSEIFSRYDTNVDPKVNGTFPLITAPMDMVVGPHSEADYIDNDIVVCLPRRKEMTVEQLIGDNRAGVFVSMSQEQFVDVLLSEELLNFLKDDKETDIKVCLDTANGHMQSVVHSISLIDDYFKKQGRRKRVIIMTGNVASVEGYEILSRAGADMIRVGIGFGGGCLTTQQTGVGRGMASLISDCYVRSGSLDHPAKIIADGGMRKYSDIIKALALGADYVMIGSMFARAVEAEGPVFKLNEAKEIPRKEVDYVFHDAGKLERRFRGMSTKEVQRSLGVENPRTSEGVIRMVPVEYTLRSWIDNFESYLRSTMSYVGAHDLQELKERARFRRISSEVLRAFSK